MTIATELRCNQQIRISPIRLIDEENQQLGIVETKDAMARAQEAGLDLVEVAPTSRPPVCRIMDYGKWKYAQRKKEQRSKAKRHETELKEIRIKTPKIGDHDLSIKVAHAREFLTRGDRVQFTLRFRGRELAHIDEGQKVFEHIKTDLAEVAKVDQNFRREGRRITMTLAPVARKVEQPRRDEDQAPKPQRQAPPASEGENAPPQPAAQDQPAESPQAPQTPAQQQG